MAYSIKIGVWKSIKNVLIVSGVPALVILIDNWAKIIPDEYHGIAVPIIGLISYFVKNYIQNRK